MIYFVIVKNARRTTFKLITFRDAKLIKVEKDLLGNYLKVTLESQNCDFLNKTTKEYVKCNYQPLVFEEVPCEHKYLEGTGTQHCTCCRCGVRMKLDAKNNKWIPSEEL